MIKLSGFDALAKQLDELQQAAEALEGDLASLSFDPHDPASIEGALKQMESAIDEKIAPWPGNAMVTELAESIKAQYREAILDKAMTARVQAENGDGV